MKKVKFSIRKYNGDDVYSWAVFRSDFESPIVSGLARVEAIYYRETLKKEHEEKLNE